MEMKSMEYPPADFLCEAFVYNKKTGRLFWRKTRPDYHFASATSAKAWHTRTAGKEVGCSCDFKPNETYSHILRTTCFKYAGEQANYYCHKIIWIMNGGKRTALVSHKNGNTLDNRMENLSPEHRSVRSGKSGVYGVSALPNGKWAAKVGEGKGKQKHHGTFDTIDDAAAVVKREYWDKL